MTSPKDFPWPQWKARLKELHDEGMTITAIAKVLGGESRHYCTRNMVISALHRFGFREKSAAAAFWTDARVACLKLGWTKGRSAAEIGKTFGITAQAVRQKASRLYLPAREMHQSVQAKIERSAVKKKSPPLPKTPPLSEERKEFILGKGIPLMELKPDSCRWIVTDLPRFGDHLYCGEKQAEGSSYCEGHCRKAWARTAGRTEEAA